MFEDFQDGHHGTLLGYQNGNTVAILNYHVLSFLLSFQLNPTRFGRNNFKMATMVTILAIRTEWLEQFWISMLPWCLQPRLGSTGQSWEQMWLQDFQDGCHGLDIGMQQFLAILNLHVAPIPPTKFQLNPTYDSGGDVKNWELLMDIRMTDRPCSKDQGISWPGANLEVS